MEQKLDSAAALHTSNNFLFTQMIHDPVQVLKTVEIIFFARGFSFSKVSSAHWKITIKLRSEFTKLANYLSNLDQMLPKLVALPD